MDPKHKVSRKTGAVTKDDFWPLLVEFALSQKTWWIGLCEEFELTAMQGHALRMLEPSKPVAMSALAETLACDASNVTGIIDKLELRGLIARQGADNDRRIKMLAVTDKGRRMREQLCARMMVPPETVTAIPVDARRRLAEVLRAVVLERSED